MSDQVNLPRVSVIIANHNYGRWISEAMQSVDAQRDYPYRQIVVVDDGSTDESWQTIQQAAKFSAPDNPEPNQVFSGRVGQTKVTAYRFLNPGGPSKSRNTAIRLAWDSTDVFAPLDADDVFLPHNLSKRVAKIMVDPARIAGCYADYETIDANGVIVREYKPPYSQERLFAGDCMVHSGNLISRPVLEKIGVFDESLRVCEDFDIWLRAATENFMFVHVPECLTRVRVGAHQSSATVPSQRWQACYQRVMEKTRERLERRGV